MTEPTMEPKPSVDPHTDTQIWTVTDAPVRPVLPPQRTASPHVQIRGESFSWTTTDDDPVTSPEYVP